MATSPTTHLESRALPAEDFRRLLTLLFGPSPVASSEEQAE
ncbi:MULTISPECIES: hypothetical protein [Microbacterium]|nr:hypothetical protein [Microbacterium oleivorans]